jgi:N-methylhydantoinase B
MPHGLTLKRTGSAAEERLGSIFSDVPIGEGDIFSRPTAGGGGFGDPLERDPNLVIEDIKDDYVSIERAAKDYGVVVHTIDAELCSYEVDKLATEVLRAKIRAERIANVRLDPEVVAERYRSGTIDTFDVIRKHAVILDWGTGALLPESTRQFRDVFERRSVAMWT